MPGSATGVTLQFRKWLHFIRHINYGGGGESVIGLSSEPDLSSQLASNSNQTLDYLPCPIAQGTPHRYAALFHGSGNSLQTRPKAPGLLSPLRGVGLLAGRAPAPTGDLCPAGSSVSLC